MRRFQLLALAAFLFAAAPGWAQQAPAGAASSDAVRDALAKKDGDVDQSTLLKDTLTAVDKQYSLIRKGHTQVNYEFNYAYIGQEKINADLSSGTATLFSIENTSSHTITNTLMVDHGVLDNLSANVTMPFISRYSDAAGYSGVSHTIGDLSLGVRWQPLESKRDETTFTVTSSVRLATGTSPFKVDPTRGLATGSGTNMLNLGLNSTKIVDPVALFGSVSVGAGAPVRHLSQMLSGAVLKEVRPGATVGFGLGFAYALSYKITTSFSFQEAITAHSRLTFEDGREAQTGTQSAGVLAVGLGFRSSPKTTVNVTVGAGLTASAPNMSITVGVPLSM